MVQIGDHRLILAITDRRHIAPAGNGAGGRAAGCGRRSLPNDPVPAATRASTDADQQGSPRMVAVKQAFTTVGIIPPATSLMALLRVRSACPVCDGLGVYNASAARSVDLGSLSAEPVLDPSGAGLAGRRRAGLLPERCRRHGARIETDGDFAEYPEKRCHRWKPAGPIWAKHRFAPNANTLVADLQQGY